MRRIFSIMAAAWTLAACNGLRFRGDLADHASGIRKRATAWVCGPEREGDVAGYDRRALNCTARLPGEEGATLRDSSIAFIWFDSSATVLQIGHQWIADSARVRYIYETQLATLGLESGSTGRPCTWPEASEARAFASGRHYAVAFFHLSYRAIIVIRTIFEPRCER